MPLLEIVFQSGSAASKSEARRLIQQGGVRINGEQAKDPLAEVQISDEPVVRVGKLTWLRVRSQ
jgi:tyrosyl-tRNA synthetase